MKRSYVRQAVQTAYALLVSARKQSRTPDLKTRLTKAIKCLEEDPLLAHPQKDAQEMIDTVEEMLR